MSYENIQLEAAYRLTAATSEEDARNLRDFVASLSKEQREYLLFGLPKALFWGWLGQGFKRNLKTNKVILSSSSQVIAVAGQYGAVEFQRFIVGMLHLRNIFPPQVTKGKIQRLTAVKKMPGGRTVAFRNTEQYRSLTSWTTLLDPKVVDREKPKGTQDIVLSYELPSAKNVLFDFISIKYFLIALFADKDFYLTTYLPSPEHQKFKNLLTTCNQQLSHYFHEHEVALYLNAEQEIQCTWSRASTW